MSSFIMYVFSLFVISLFSYALLSLLYVFRDFFICSLVRYLFIYVVRSFVIYFVRCVRASVRSFDIDFLVLVVRS